MNNMVRFGSAGNPESFYEQGGTSSLKMPKWLFNMGLDAYEYQCGRGVRISKDSAEKLKSEAKKYNVALSLHAPYFVNISSTEEEKIERTIGYIMQAVRAAANMDARRVVVHMGSAIDITRKAALDISKQTIYKILKMMEEENLGHIHICPETMGKINQMGTLDEVLELCKLDERLIPTIDFGHLNSRGQGHLKTSEDFEQIIDRIIKVLGEGRGCSFHCHFSKIAYTKGGEKKHLTFDDDEFGPEFAPLAKVIAKRGLTPVIICESAGTQAEDALQMKKIYEGELA